ncbi:DUF2378 family protein [Pyxidicoccus xibeiensis]|uniref:DUF2378 family protein n=1 Tax=Pyxidicoccus xibeiensis TaxID=2906759 RepID=UPI0020A798DF|nr:DUF2378 family protein [Pyxidicoccus xibeiensis]MCP3136680.1 DUF2378 family protein [Pyxidicoccus xibeiensis]
METPDPRLIFSGTVQGLFLVGLRERLSLSTRASLREAGLDLDQDLLPAYPLSTWLRCQDIVLRTVWPDLPREEAQRRLGHAAVDGMMATMLGRVMSAAARTLGPRMGLGQLNRGLRASNNFQESRVTERGPGSIEVWINDIAGRPAYYVGILEASVRVMGARDPRVSVLRHEAPACTFLVEWVG